MNQRQLAGVLFAVVGVFIAASRLPEFFLHGAILARWDPASEDPAAPVSPRVISLLALVALGLAVLIGIALVMLRSRLAAWLFPSTSGPLAAHEAQAVALSVLGCYFVVQGVQASLWPGSFRWGAMVQAVLGLALFVGARGLAGLWATWRLPGRAREPGSGAA